MIRHTGYMSPEILIGDEFSLPTDIFSLGVIFCEIAARKLVDDNVFVREMPMFAMDSDEIRRRASKGCPPAFLELCLSCVEVEPEKRPKIRAILEQLNVIECDIIAAEKAQGNNYNVGSLTFSAKHGRKGKAKRTKAGRIPSFDGKSGPKYSSPEDSEEDSSDEDVEATIARLDKLQIGGKGPIYLNSGAAEATSRLNDSQSSTYSVIKGSRSVGRSSILTQVHLPATSSSLITMKGHQDINPPPALPESAISAKPMESSVLSEGTAPASFRKSQAIESAGHAANPHILTTSSIATSHSASSSDTDTPATPEEAFGEVLPPSLPIVTDSTPGSLPESKFATIRSLSMPIAASPETKASSRVHGTGVVPHRFTLVKPGWRALWDGSAPGGSATPLDKNRKRVSGISNKRNSLDAERPSAVRKSSDGERSGLGFFLPTSLLGAGLLTRCKLCERRLGLLKPYLACDDCQHM